jgi:hypothetical protein
MQRHVRRIVVFTVPAALAFLGTFLFAQAQPAPNQPAPMRKAGGAQPARVVRFVELVNEPINTADYQGPNLTLRDFLTNLNEYIEKRLQPNLAIVVDFEAFKNENPDAYKEESDLYDVKVRIPTATKWLPLVTMLRKALDHIPTNNATFIIRRGKVEVTTTARATPLALAQEKVVIAFDRRPLAEAVQELSEITGASIVIDPRTGDKRDLPVTAVFLNDVSLKTALTMLADMAGLKAVMLEQGLYVTTPENAVVLGKEFKARQREELWRREKGLPEPGGPVSPGGRRAEAAAALLPPAGRLPTAE